MNFINHYLKESEFVEDYPIKYFDTEYILTIYKDPNGNELYKVYNDSQGEGGCRIGIDSMNQVYVWMDNIDHEWIEKKFDLKFVGRFSHPDMTNRTMYLSSIYDEGKVNDIFSLIPKKAIKKLFVIFPNIDSIKSLIDHRVLYTNK